MSEIRAWEQWVIGNLSMTNVSKHPNGYLIVVYKLLYELKLIKVITIWNEWNLLPQSTHCVMFKWMQSRVHHYAIAKSVIAKSDPLTNDWRITIYCTRILCTFMYLYLKIYEYVRSRVLQLIRNSTRPNSTVNNFNPTRQEPDTLKPDPTFTSETRNCTLL